MGDEESGKTGDKETSQLDQDIMEFNKEIEIKETEKQEEDTQQELEEGAGILLPITLKYYLACGNKQIKAYQN